MLFHGAANSSCFVFTTFSQCDNIEMGEGVEQIGCSTQIGWNLFKCLNSFVHDCRFYSYTIISKLTKPWAYICPKGFLVGARSYYRNFTPYEIMTSYDAEIMSWFPNSSHLGSAILDPPSWISWKENHPKWLKSNQNQWKNAKIIEKCKRCYKKVKFS